MKMQELYNLTIIMMLSLILLELSDDWFGVIIWNIAIWAVLITIILKASGWAK